MCRLREVPSFPALLGMLGQSFMEETLQEKTVAHDERLGVAQKCTFCIDRVDDGLEDGLTPGKDWSATVPISTRVQRDAAFSRN